METWHLLLFFSLIKKGLNMTENSSLCLEAELTAITDNLAGYIAQGADFNKVTTSDEFYEDVDKLLKLFSEYNLDREDIAERIRTMIKEQLA